MWGNKILLVDDEEIILRALKKDFEQEGYEVITASRGEEAVKLIQAQHFDMLVTDLSMPGMDGIAVLTKAKEISPDIGAIVLTGYGYMTSATEVLKLGADDYLLKPCDAEELLLRIARCLKSKEALQKVKFYEEILPVCTYCKSIRDIKNGRWMKMEEYMDNKSRTEISHGYCPECHELHKKS